MTKRTDNSQPHYRHADWQGSVAMVTDANGKVEQHNGYYPYGEPWREPTGQPYLFGGKERLRDNALNEYDFAARRLQSSLCLWTAPDPMATDYAPTNPYTYCAANPVKFTDPTGKATYLNSYNLYYLGTDGDENTANSVRIIDYDIFYDCIYNNENPTFEGITTPYVEVTYNNEDAYNKAIEIRDATLKNPVEHQAIFSLDKTTGVISVINGETGTKTVCNGDTDLGSNNLYYIGQMHTHPMQKGLDPNVSDVDKKSSKEIGGAVYAIETRKGDKSSNIYKASPDGSSYDHPVGSLPSKSNGEATGVALDILRDVLNTFINFRPKVHF